MTVECDIVAIEHLPDEYREEAKSFVISSWVADYRPSSSVRGVSPTVYRVRQRQLIQTLMSDKRAETRVATLPGAPDVFIGWSVSDPLIGLHYVYVKAGWRRGGVGARLVPGLKRGHRHTHTSHIRWVREWLERKGSVYDPYLLMKGIEE